VFYGQGLIIFLSRGKPDTAIASAIALSIDFSEITDRER